ncbi:hypothetical protein CYMTET_52354 [Cymbomonas tetramitiformis]|uniref:Uncharacterized protein n=1 Tax=Cymbomonas tetramitiformis TaxID=36881 RepID=A0AAE0BL02_9CHLO|nr:hypothetical protein CYMTET_52354 [Cymbomonas tetramitiformis]
MFNINLGSNYGGSISEALIVLFFEENNAKVTAIYAKRRHRQWAKAVRELSLGGKDQYFEAAKDSEKLFKIVVVLKNEFSSAGLDLSSFEFDDLAKGVIPKVNELLYDTLAYIVKSDSAAEHFLLGTDSVSDRDARRALLDLIKGCVPPGVRQTLQEEHSQLRYAARVDPQPLLAREQRLVAADDGLEAFAAAVAEYDAPAVLAPGGESDGIDVSAYGFAVRPTLAAA